MAEWLKAAVLKTAEGHASAGSNPAGSANATASGSQASHAMYFCKNIRAFGLSITPPKAGLPAIGVACEDKPFGVNSYKPDG